ncbi:MAG: hydrogenase 4 subunit F, partial [Beggiatoa sp. IS2]
AWDVWQQGTYLSANKLFYLDAFNICFVVLTTFIAMDTAIFSQPYMLRQLVRRRVQTTQQLRLYHVMYQGFLFAMLLALTTNNLGLLWVAMEAATLATVLLVSLYRSPEAIEAAWKYFILCGVGIAQALFGTVMLYFAAEKVIENHPEALLWSVLHAQASQLEPTVMSIAFVFLLVGYGTKAGLVPLHNWLPDAYSESPMPLAILSSGLLLNVALYALVRIKTLVDASLHNPLAGHLMMGFGLLTFLVAVLFLHRQRDIKRLYSYSSIEHVGLMTLAFGIGTPLSTFAGLLHTVAHALTKSAVFMVVAHAAILSNSKNIDKIRGLLRTQPTVGWSLILGTTALAGFPPFGLFTSEFLLLMATMQTYPWLTIPLLLGFGIAFAGLFRHLQPMVYGEAPTNLGTVKLTLVPVILQLLLVLWLGLAMPPALAHWFNQATQMISGGIVS